VASATLHVQRTGRAGAGTGGVVVAMPEGWHRTLLGLNVRLVAGHLHGTEALSDHWWFFARRDNGMHQEINNADGQGRRNEPRQLLSDASRHHTTRAHEAVQQAQVGATRPGTDRISDIATLPPSASGRMKDGHGDVCL
jgi:hypothetical protein